MVDYEKVANAINEWNGLDSNIQTATTYDAFARAKGLGVKEREEFERIVRYNYTAGGHFGSLELIGLHARD